MFRTLTDFISDITGGQRDTEAFGPGDYRLAAAALLVHVVSIDGEMSDVERDKVKSILATRFDLDETASSALIQEAIVKDAEAIDLYAFTSTLNRALDDVGRQRIVEMMFQVAFADGNLTEFEDNLVARASELLHISDRDRVEIRREIREEVQADGEQEG